MVAGESCHAKLSISGIEYELNLATELLRDFYSEKDISSWSPKVASGDLNYSNLSVWNWLASDDFRKGFGHRAFDDPAGYHKSGGSIDTRHGTVAQLATKIVASDENLTAQVYQYIDYGGYLWAATGAGLRVFDPGDSTWAACTDTKVDTELCYALLNNGAYLFVARNGAQILKASTVAANPEATVFSTTGVDSYAADFRYLALGGGRMWASKDGDNHIHYSATIDGTDWDGDSGDANRITVGPGDPSGDTAAVPITGMQWFNGYLYVAREDGLWAVSVEDSKARQVLDWANERRTTNGKGMRVWNDRLIIPVGPRLFSFTGTTISDITPPSIGQTFPYTQYGNFESMATFGPYLYVAAQEGASNNAVQTLRPGGVGSNSNWVVGAPAGESAWQATDDTTVDYYTSYIRSTSTNYTLETVALGNTSGLSGKVISSVTVFAVVRSSQLSGTGINYYKLAVLESGQSVSYGSEFEVETGADWQTLSSTWTSKPSGGAWTSATIDALEIGLAGKCDPSAWQVACTQLRVEVAYADTVPYRLLCWDGAAWHNLGSLDAGGKCLWFSAATDDLWVNTYNTAGANYDTQYMATQQHSFLPYDSYSTTGTHELETSRIDCGLKAVDKCFNSLYVFSNNLTSARYIKPYYRTSGDTWVELETTNHVYQSPEQIVDLSNIVAKYIEFKFGFVTDAAAQSPVLEAWALKFIARPDTIYGYPIAILIGDYVQGYDGRVHKVYTAQAFKDALRSARDSKIPVTFTTPWNEAKTVFVTAYTLTHLKFDDPDPGQKSAMIVLNMVEA